MTGEITIVKPGLLTTIQDLGRWGYQVSGVPVAGPMDMFSHRLANQLVGNDPQAAALEVTLIGPEMLFESRARIAVTGAIFDLTCDERPVAHGETVVIEAGQRLRFGRLHQGARAYVGIGGGVATESILGSRSTHLVSHMGGYDGRALAAGDRIPIGDADVSGDGGRKAPGFSLPTGGRARLRVIPGPQADWFDEDVLKTLTSVSFRVSPRSNRMGYRLEGPPLLRSREGEPISEPVGIGAIQVPNAGEPILLMADRQTAGGYPKIGHVITADLPLAGQLAPGDFIDFALCSRQEAIAALIARERQLFRWQDARGGQ